MPSKTTVALLSLSLHLISQTPVHAANYTLSRRTKGAQFYQDYAFWTAPDPNNGRVNYVSQQLAQSTNLSYADNNTFILKTDDKTVLKPTDPGRDAIRISSYAVYDTHVVIFDFQHMPQGNATWPAAWEYGPNWPYGGEIDILEGINDEGPNLSSLHLGQNCTMPSNSSRVLYETGIPYGSDCNANHDFDQGCGVHVNKNNSYGPDFNANGGGWYAMERTPQAVNVWFWGRQEARIPYDMATGAEAIDTSKWGLPFANFPANPGCPDFASNFAKSNITIDLDLCGGWAGNAYPGGIDVCNTFVDNNPEAFSEAYWEIGFVNVYE